jgi:hypothetical protein
MFASEHFRTCHNIYTFEGPQIVERRENAKSFLNLPARPKVVSSTNCLYEI